MNLLITNTQEEQAYLILRSLRHVANRIVVTVPDESVFSRLSAISAWSRHVSKRYTVPDCSVEWRAGRLHPDNSPAEEKYILRIEAICASERIDVIFPSYDAEVMVFSKNKSRLAAQGIVAVVPDYATVIRMLDKELTLQGAKAVGFPIPETFVPANETELLEAASRLSPPWVLKPRCNAHGANIRLVRDLDSLKSAFAELAAEQPRPLLQEFVPALTKRNYYLVVTPEFEVVSVHSPLIRRYRTIGVRTPSAAAVATDDVPLLAEVKALVKELGIWGGMTLQTIVNARDGVPRLMEINPRFGHNLWYRTEFGINEPLIYMRNAQGKSLQKTPSWPTDVLLLDPLWDLLHLYLLSLDRSKIWLRKCLGRSQSDPEPLNSQSVRTLARDLKSEYFGPEQRVTNPLNRGFFSDPAVPFVRMGRTILFEFLRRRTLSRKAKGSRRLAGSQAESCRQAG